MRDLTKSVRHFAALAVCFCVIALCPTHAAAQLAKDKGRFVGNALTSGIPIYSNFSTYWNQVSPGNAGKWESVEGLMNSYDWTWLDAFYNYSRTQSFPFRHHCLVWGAQQPAWIAGLDSAQQRAKVEQWINAVGTRYGSMSMVDVVNEPFHQAPPYMHALGDSGKTGWDWIITAFRWARQYCSPAAKLTINEYNVLQDNAVTTRYLALIDTLRARKLVDAIGIQGHYFEFKSYAGAPNSYSYPVATLKYNLERLVATGLPVYISEFDINEESDSIQLANYKTYFPLFWENPGVAGITLWGYMQGDMWKVNGYLIRSNGTERPALKWLRTYIASPLPPALISPVSTAGEPRNPRLVWHPSVSALSYRVQVATTGGFTTMVVDTTVTDTLHQLSPLNANARYYWRVTAANDSGSSSYSVAVFTTGDLIQGVEETSEAPLTFALEQNYPNPFNPGTSIGYTVAGTGHEALGNRRVRLAVYDLLGRHVAVLVDEKKAPGRYVVKFDGTQLSSGMYLCRMTAGEFVESRKMHLVK